MKNEFESYLQEICFKENPQVLDDDMPEFFDQWLAGLDVDELIKYGDEHGKQMLYD